MGSRLHRCFSPLQDAPLHGSYTTFALIMVAIYPLGIPGWIGFSLWRYRRAIAPKARLGGEDGETWCEGSGRTRKIVGVFLEEENSLLLVVFFSCLVIFWNCLLMFCLKSVWTLLRPGEFLIHASVGFTWPRWSNVISPLTSSTQASHPAHYGFFPSR